MCLPEHEQHWRIDGGRQHEQVAQDLLETPHRVLVARSPPEDLPLRELLVDGVGAPAEQLEEHDYAQGLVDPLHGFQVS